jgi:hypothetical protein
MLEHFARQMGQLAGSDEQRVMRGEQGNRMKIALGSIKSQGQPAGLPVQINNPYRPAVNLKISLIR